MKNPTVVDTRQAVALGHISLFAFGIATYKYPAPSRHLRLAAPPNILRHKCGEHPKEDLERKPKSTLSEQFI